MRNDSDRIRMKFWGVRGTLPVPGHRSLEYGGNTSCVTLDFPQNELFVFDAGSGIKELSNDLFQNKTIPDRELRKPGRFSEIAFAKGYHLEEYCDFAVDQIMSREVATAGPDASLEGLAQMMLDRGVRRILIVEEGRFVGVVSSMDLLPYVERENVGAH